MKKIIAMLPALVLVLPLAAGAVSVNTQITGEASGKADVADIVEANVNADLDASVSSENETSVESQAQAAASAQAEFEATVETVKAQDASLEKANITADGAVDVAYAHNGALLGFIPIKVTSHTSVAADENGEMKVTVRFPWWSFLVAGISTIESDVQSSLSVNADVKANAAAGGSVSSRARLVQAVASALHTAQINATAEASASASATASEN